MTILVFIGSLLGLMALGMPVAFALIGCGIAMMFYMGVTDPQIVIQNMWDGANSFPLLAVPFFMLAGEFMNAGGMTRRIIDHAGSGTAMRAPQAPTRLPAAVGSNWPRIRATAAGRNLSCAMSSARL